MSFNGSGTYTLVYTWATEELSPPIPVSKLDEQEQDMATAISNCVTRDGQSQPTADMPMNGKRLLNLGDATGATDALNRQSADARYVSAHNPVTIDFLMTLTSGLALNSVQQITLTDIDRETDGKNWRIQMGSGALQFAAWNDALGLAGVALNLTRIGDVPQDAKFALAGTLQVNGNVVWHTGNDGSGSGLDADLLDGQSGSFYQNAGNLTAGTLPDARVAQSSVTQYQAEIQAANLTGRTGIAKTLSTSAPSGGADGDIWYQY